MRPKSIKDIIGQQQCKVVINTLITFAKNNNDLVPPILISGPSGYGKTTIANAIANDVGSNLFTINCAMVSKPKHILEIIEEMSDKDLLFLDEIHALSNKTSESLYTLIEDGCFFENGSRIDIPKITILAASTSIGSIPTPLKNRFKFVGYLEPYTEQELIDVCFGICQEKGFKLTKNLASIIAKTSRGIPRIIVSRTEWIYQYMTSNNIKSINHEELIKIIGYQGVDENGLEQHDIDYLKILYKNRGGLSLNALSSKLQTNSDNIKNIIEPFLLKLGLIEISAGRGRTLSRDGKKYAEKLK